MYDHKPETGIGDVLVDVLEMLETLENTKSMTFNEKLDLAGTLLQYMAAGNDIRKPLAENVPIPVNLIPAPFFSANKRLCVSPSRKQYFLQVQVPENQPPMHLLTCWRHNPPCGKQLRRPHLMCTHCLYMKRQRQQIPEYVPVQLIIWAFRHGSRFERLRTIIVKRLQEELEFVSDF